MPCKIIYNKVPILARAKLRKSCQSEESFAPTQDPENDACPHASSDYTLPNDYKSSRRDSSKIFVQLGVRLIKDANRACFIKK